MTVIKKMSSAEPASEVESYDDIMMLNQVRALKRAAATPRADEFCRDALDFPEELLPFGCCLEYTMLSRQTKHLIATGANLQFVEDTQELELGLLSATTVAARGIGLCERTEQLLIETASVEEANHALQSSVQSKVTRHFRNYTARIPPGLYLRRYVGGKARARGARASLFAIARASALEIEQVMLYRLAHSASASAWQTKWHALHLIEESEHQRVFGALVREVYAKLSRLNRGVLADELIDAAYDLGTFDREAWTAILTNAGVSNEVATVLLDRSSSAPAPATAVVTLLREFGVSDNRIFRRSGR